MKILINILINILIKHSRIFSLIMVIKKKKWKEGKNEFISKEIVKKAMYVYGMIISVKLQHILKIYSDDDLEWTSHYSCIFLIDSPTKLNSFDKRNMLSEGLVSLHFRSVQQLFVSWPMVPRLTLLTNTEMGNFYPIYSSTTRVESGFIFSTSRSCLKRCRAWFWSLASSLCHC